MNNSQKAPKNVVEQERSKLAENVAIFEKLQQQLKNIC